MPIIKSAKKRVRKSEVRRKKNASQKIKNHELFKEISELIKKQEKEKALELLPKYYASIDRMAKRNIVHKNKAARKKSSVTIQINSIKEKKED